MKTIEFNQYGLGRYTNASPFPFGDLELELQNIPETNGDFRFIGKINGAECAFESVTATQNHVFISADKLSEGRFSCRLIQYMDGKEIAIYTVEDLLITKDDTAFLGSPEIQTMQDSINALLADVNLLKTLVKTLTAALQEEKEKSTEIDKRLTTLETNNDMLLV